MPGAAVLTTSITPVEARRLATRRKPWSWRYSSSASAAEIERTSRSGTRFVNAGLPSSSTANTRRPASAPARASSAVTVVLPTPPLPATITTGVSSWATSIGPGNVTFGTLQSRSPHAAVDAPGRGSRRHHLALPCRAVRKLLIGLMAALAMLSVAAPAAASGRDEAAPDEAASEEAAPDEAGVAPVDVFQVRGLFDAIIIDSIGDAIDRAERKGSQALVLQVDSRGAIV